MSAQLIIKTHSPWKFWLKWLLMLGILGVVAWLMFGVGKRSAGQVNVTLQQEQTRLQEKLYQIGRENTELREKYAVLERASQIDKESYVAISENLTNLQNELLELKQEVAFYRGIVAPSEAASGLHITNLTFDPLGEESGFHFKLVLTQVMKNEYIVRGRVRIFIEGLQAGQQKQLTLSQVSGGKLEDDLTMNFKYFQNIEGDIVLPDGFVPSSVIVDLIPTGKGRTRIKKNFEWADITSQG
ncbi:MAG: hypothetical protein PVF82_13475 [Gammaproteobacteria bacterium]|jgi:hypothetical protein